MRPELELYLPASAVIRRIFDMALQGKNNLEIAKTVNAEGIPTTNGRKWLKTTAHRMPGDEAYTGTLIWRTNAKDGAPPETGDNRGGGEGATGRAADLPTQNVMVPCPNSDLTML